MCSKIDTCIDLDGNKYKKKKLNPESDLANIRMQLKLENNIFFLSKEGYDIAREDEEETLLKDIVREKGDVYLLSLKTEKDSNIIINIYFNNEKINTGTYPKNMKIKDLLKHINLNQKNVSLLSDGYLIDQEDYEDEILSNYLENNNLYFQNSSTEQFPSRGGKNDGEEEIITIIINNEKIIKKLKPSLKLNELREELKKDLDFRFKFLFKETGLEEREEKKWRINDIVINEDNNKIIFIENCEIKNNTAIDEGKKEINFYNSDKFLFKCKLDINQNLEEIRDDISEIFEKDFIFMKRKKPIDEIKESNYLLKDIVKENNVNIKLINDENKEEEIQNIALIKFKLNDKQLFANKIDINLTLFEIRKENKSIPDNSKFTKDGYAVPDEKNTKIKDILKDKEFILLEVEEEDEGKKEEKDPPKEIKPEIKKYKIYLNNKFLKYAQYKENTPLDELRNILSTSISNKEIFISSENDEIPLDNEDNWTLKELCNENRKINIKTIKESESEKPKKELNEPIKEAALISAADSNLAIYKYPNKPFNDIEKTTCKTIMVVGETGSGKTTLLNSLLNYLMDIKFEDYFRYKIIVENTKNLTSGSSVTDKVNIYDIRTKKKELPYLRIVDTPGFGDTRGLDFDKKIIDMIRDTFTHKCETINAICFVAKSNETRLTDFQKYIFAQVFALFGKDVGENIIAMLTFCDGQEPNIIKSLESKDSIFYQIKEQIEDPWYLTFNNSAIYCEVEQKFTKHFWDMGMDMFKTFLTKLNKLPTKSLTLSKKVLDLRKQLEATIIGLKPQLDKSLMIMESMRKLISEVKANKDKIDQFKDFEYDYKEPKVTKKKLGQGQYTSNCLVCNYTCHYPCYINDDNKKNNCSAMKNGFCTVCKNKCEWTNHKNLSFIFEYEEVVKKKTSEDLRKKYVESTSKLKASEQILKGLEKDFLNILEECYKNAETIRDCVEKLKTDSLCKNPNESFENYIKSCIINEENQKNPGYEERIKGYQTLKDTNDKIIQAFKGQSVHEDLEKFKKYISEEKDKILKMYEKEDKKGSSCNIF